MKISKCVLFSMPRVNENTYNIGHTIVLKVRVAYSITRSDQIKTTVSPSPGNLPAIYNSS